MTGISSRLARLLRWPLAYLTAGLLWAAGAQTIVGCGRLSAHPATLAAMAAFKATEARLYWSAAFGVPVLSLVLGFLPTTIAAFLERRRGAPFARLRDVGPLVLLPSIVALAIIRHQGPGLGWLAGLPILGAAAMLGVIVAWDAARPVAARFPETDAAPFVPPRAPFSWLRFAAFAIVTPALLYQLAEKPPIDGDLHAMDEGLRLAAVEQVSLGLRPYRDVYLQYGIGTEILQPLAAFHLFGESLEAQRRLERAIAPMGLLALYALAMAALRRPLITILFLFLALGRTDVWLSPRAAMGLLAFACAIEAARVADERRAFRWSAGAGLLTGLGFLYSLDGGVLPAAALVTAFALNRLFAKSGTPERRTADLCLEGYLGGGALVAIPFLGWLLANGGLPSFFGDLRLLLGGTWTAAWGKPTPPLCEPLLAALRQPWVVFRWEGGWSRWWIPVFVNTAALTAAIAGAIKRRGRPDPALLIPALGGVFFFAIALGRSDLEHWLRGTPAVYLLVTIGAVRAVDALRAPRRGSHDVLFDLAWGGAAIFLACLVANPSLPQLVISRVLMGSEPLPLQDARPVHDPRWGAVSIPVSDADERETILAALQSRLHKGDSLYIFTDDAIYYFLTETINPTRYDNLSYIAGDRMVNDAIEGLERRPPKVILAVNKNGRVDHADKNAAIAAWIERRYRVTARPGPYLLLEPKPAE